LIPCRSVATGQIVALFIRRQIRSRAKGSRPFTGLLSVSNPLKFVIGLASDRRRSYFNAINPNGPDRIRADQAMQVEQLVFNLKDHRSGKPKKKTPNKRSVTIRPKFCYCQPKKLAAFFRGLRADFHYR